jgi:hypothetical protein
MKRNSNFYTKPVILILAILAVTALYFIVANSNFGSIKVGGIEGLATSTGDAKPDSVADADPDLKCPGAEEPAKCEIADLMKLAYDISSDPRTSVMELNAIQKVCDSRKVKGYDKFAMDAMMLRAATMFNTTENEKEFKSILDDMTKNKKECYTNDFMKSIKGLLVGSKDEATLTVAQSESVRCYAHRFNAFRRCLKACK